MVDPQNSNTSNQFDTSSESQQLPPSKPTITSTPPKNKVVFTVDDMATSSYSKDASDNTSFTISALKSDDHCK